MAAAKKNPLTWPQAKAFALEVCQQVARDNPQRYVINMAKKLRGGRIFLDYLRNDRMATAVAPLSPRPARRDSLHAADLVTGEGGPGSKRFTIRSVPAILGKSKAWTKYCDSERPLEEAIKRLGKAKVAA